MKVRDIVILAFLTAFLFVVQAGFAFLPNIELVSLLIITYTIVFGRKVFVTIYGFVVLEGIFYGFGIWWISYLYIWSLLAIVTLLIRRRKSVWFWCVISGAYGLGYGLLCAIPYFLTAGLGAGAAYWIAGIPFDITHCFGNVVLCLVLFKPILYILGKMEGNYKI